MTDRNQLGAPPYPGHNGLPVSHPATESRHAAWQPAPALDTVNVADEAIRSWESAYRNYGQVRNVPVVPSEISAELRRQMVSASWAVASAWRQIARTRRLPWWLLAAVESAAQAFEAQARDWEARGSASSASGEFGGEL